MDGRAEAERWLVIAQKLLEARDFLAAKKFADRAIDSDPLLDGPDQILAVADVLLASTTSDNPPNYYSILQVPPSSDLQSIKRSYRRLSLLLRPDKNPSPGASEAFQLVSDAFSLLSDDARRRVYDRDLRPHPDPPPPERTPSPETFWTLCPSCYRAFEYRKDYESRRLLCQVCRKPFHAAKLPTEPPVVPGTDMFYCSWGLFPLGFPGFNSIEIPPGTPCVPAMPSAVLPTSKTPEKDAGSTPTTTRSSARLRAMQDAPPVSEAPAKAKKVMARKPRKQSGSGGADVGGGFDMNSFSKDADHSSSGVLDNLANLPFLKDDDLAMMT